MEVFPQIEVIPLDDIPVIPLEDESEETGKHHQQENTPLNGARKGKKEGKSFIDKFFPRSNSIFRPRVEEDAAYVCDAIVYFWQNAKIQSQLLYIPEQCLHLHRIP